MALITASVLREVAKVEYAGWRFKRVIGWAISESMTATRVSDALTIALWNRKMPTGVIAHIGRGSQYCSATYQKLFHIHPLICSMSKKGDCYDNAAMESLNHSFKVEVVHGERFKTRSEAKSQVFEYIEVYYLSLGTIANGFIQYWAILAQKLLQLKKSLSGGVGETRARSLSGLVSAQYAN